MFLRLLLLLTIVPAVELWLLLEIGERIGGLETIWLIILTGVIGASLAKREGLAVILRIQEEAQNGIPPGERLVEGLMILLGGVLLLTPGVITDLFGLMMIFPLTRRPMSRITKRWLSTRVQVQGVNIGPAAPGPAAQKTRDTLKDNGSDTPAGDHFDHPVA